MLWGEFLLVLGVGYSFRLGLVSSAHGYPTSFHLLSLIHFTRALQMSLQIMASSPSLALACSRMFLPVQSDSCLLWERHVPIHFTIIYPLSWLLKLNYKLKEGRGLRYSMCLIEA